MAVIPQVYMDAVVSIGVRSAADIKWIGTGFFVIREVQEGHGIPFLVSNRHVFEIEKSIVIRMKKKDSDDLKECDAPLFNGDAPIYVCHPDPDIDIAVLPLVANYITENNLQFPCMDIDKNALTISEFRAAGLDEGSLVHMLGFPMGLVNAESQMPICRLGCVARMSDAQIREDHNIIVDIQNFPGNSGSPIVTRPELVRLNGTTAMNRCMLLGIVHSYIPYSESLVNQQTGKIVEIRSENSGLAKVHPVEYIREVIDQIRLPQRLREPQQH